MASIFTKIVNGEIPAYKVAENDRFLAFLDVNPNAKGHTLCIPKKEVDKLFDLDEEAYLDLMKFARKVAIGLEKAVPCKRVGVAVVGLEVPHVHVHLIPLNEMDEMRFTKKVSLTPSEFEELAASIREKISSAARAAFFMLSVLIGTWCRAQGRALHAAICLPDCDCPDNYRERLSLRLRLSLPTKSRRALRAGLSALHGSLLQSLAHWRP